MTKKRQNGMTKRGQEMFNIISRGIVWTTRADIADALKKRSLSPHDRELLDRMVESGLIGEQRIILENSPMTAYAYRITKQDE